MSGNLYQLRSTFARLIGHPFEVDGPHDKYGYVIDCKHEPVEGDSREYVCLVRGTGQHEPWRY